MGNLISITVNLVNCTYNANQDVQCLLCPCRESKNLRTEMEMLTKSKEAVENRISELDGQPGMVVRDEVRGWIAAVDTLDVQVSHLLDSLNRRTPCFRFLSCCSSSQNNALGQQVRDKLSELKAEHDGWNGILVRSVRSFLTAEEELRNELNKLKALKEDLGRSAEEVIHNNYGRKQKSFLLMDWCSRVENQVVPEVDRFLNQPSAERSYEERSQTISRLKIAIQDLITEGKGMIKNTGNLVVKADPEKIPHLSVPTEEELGDELNMLMALQEDLGRLADEEIRRTYGGKQKSSQLTVWSGKVDRLVPQVETFLNQTSGQRSDEERSQTISRLRKAITDLSEGGEMIKSKGNLVIMAAPKSIPDLAGSLPSFLVGTEDDISKIFAFLKDDRTSVIGIHGMGGAGKTTLVKEMVRRLRLPEPLVKFDLVAFAVVSQTPSIFNIQEEIGVRLGYSRSSNGQGNAMDINRGPSLPMDEINRKEILRNDLSGKRFLLILDDVWKELDLEQIGVPSLGSCTKSKVLLTTRELKVCEVMRCKEKLSIGRLGKEDSRKLFYNMCEKDEEYFKTKKEICEISDGILEKCGGLPLVIITVGRALASKSTIEDWRDADLLLQCFPDGFTSEMKNVFKLLKFSFDRLERDEYRSCLLSFALYPEDEDIDIAEIITYWIGEGLLEFTRRWKLEELEAYGRLIIKTLQNSCLLEKGSDDDYVKMHDTIRDMAIWLGSEEGDYKNHKFLPYESWKEKNDQPVVDDKWKDAQRICFQGMHKVVISGGEISSAIFNLRTLLFRKAHLADIPEELFTSTPNLRVLDLSENFNLHSLPESLWSLKSLRYLNLSNTAIEQIPEWIGSLTSLQFLYLKETNIKQIPVEAGQLTNLVVLDLYYNRNVSYGIPYLALASLSKLQVLDLEGTSLLSSDGGRMKELDINLVRLSSLALTLQSLEDVQQLRECHVLKKSVQMLDIFHVEKLTTADVSSVLSGLSSLKDLYIRDCPGLEGTLQLPGHSLQKLERLLLNKLPLLSCLAVESQCHLPNLVDLYVHSCDQLRDVRCLLQLPNLEYLNVSECYKMMEVIASEEEEATIEASSSSVQNIHQITSHHHYYFPKLEWIFLSHLPCLESISKVRLHLSSLQWMRVYGCPKLRKLGVIESDNNKPVTILCEKEWWEELQWEEDAAHHLITPPDNFRCQFYGSGD